MEEVTHTVTWEASSHERNEKGHDWFWGLGVLAFAAATAAFIFGDVLFGIVILLGAMTTAIFANHEPKQVQYAIFARGIQIGETAYPYTALDSFYLDEENINGPQLLIKAKSTFMPLIIMPVPKEYIDDIEDLVGARLPEEELEEPISKRLLEFFGF